MMTQEDLQIKAEQLADRVGDLFTKENIEIEVVMSVLVSMLVSTALSQADMSGVQLLRLFSQAVEKYEDHNEESEEEDEQVISRATH
jgi:hypothetical protein